MNRLFIARLWHHSRFGCCGLLVFLSCYAVAFYKKMDMVMFPYNDMFSHHVPGKPFATTYALRIDGIPLRITENLYWKKDFLEESLHNFSLYKKNKNRLFLDKYLRSKINNPARLNYLLRRLTPDSTAANKWLSWYISFAGNILPREGTVIELLQYNFHYTQNAAVVNDSAIIYKTTF